MNALIQAIGLPFDAAGRRKRAAAFSAASFVAGYQSLFAELLLLSSRKVESIVQPMEMSAYPAIGALAPARKSELASLARHPSGRPLRIAIYFNDMSGGGAERAQLALVGLFRQAGAEVELIFHSTKGELASKIPRDVPVIALETSRVAFDILPIAAYLRHSQPDIFLTGLNHNNVIACLAGLLAGRRASIVITQHNALSQEALLEGRWKYRVMPLAYRLVAPFADGIVAVSEGVADDMANISGIKRSRITTLYNPVYDLDLIARSLEPVAHPWLDDRDIPIFVTAGRLVAQKDHATLLKAFAIYRRDRVGRLMVLGAGPLLALHQSLASELGIADDVDFVGFKENPLPYYRRANAFVLPSAYEGFGNVLVEAMACGVPVISTDCAFGPSEILDRGRFGRLVPVGDATALAAAMDPDLRQHFPAAMLQRRAAHFSAEASATSYLKMFQRIISAKTTSGKVILNSRPST